jgi:cytoskeletal protein CcmA (bactofilin family)
MSMDMRIAGSGKIPAGEYGEVSVSGSGSLYGLVRCTCFSTSGSSRGESMECAEMFKVSGSSSWEGEVKTGDMKVSGSCTCEGELTAAGKVSCSGTLKCRKSLKCDRLKVSGVLTVDGDIEAEDVRVDGRVTCEGLLNAEQIEIVASRGTCIGSIGGSRIVIYRESERTKRLPLFSLLVGAVHGSVSVSGSVEGDDIALEGVTCPRVTGRIVAIGAGCHVDLVQYSEKIEVSPDAKVGRTEQI